MGRTETRSVAARPTDTIRRRRVYIVGPMIRAKAFVSIAVVGAVSLLIATADAAPGKSNDKGPKSNDDYPVVDPGGSCESAIKSYVDDYDKKKKGDPPDLTASDYGAILNDGSYLGPCDVPSNTALDLCVAVQSGQAVGVTVKATPSNEAIAACVATQLRTLSFPSAPRMDVARTHFAPEKPEHETSSTTGDAPPSPSGPPPLPPSTGCGCGNSSSGGHSAMVVALVLASLLVTRRESTDRSA